jgi:chaperonin GroES
MIRPLSDRVLVRRLPEPPLSALIIIPEIAQPESMLGEVVAVGPGKRFEDGTRRPMEIKVGDLVRFGQFNDHQDGDLVLIMEGDIRFKLDAMPTRGSFPEELRYPE